jgi:ATP-binding cassette subfamily B protein
MSHLSDEDDTFEKQRARVDKPMRRLFNTYGRANWIPLLVGLVASIGAHTLTLVPPVVLGAAVDAFFTPSPQPFTLPLVPDAWIPETKESQFWFSGIVIAVTLDIRR